MKKNNLILLIVAILLIPVFFTSIKAKAQTIGDVLMGQYTYFDPEGDPEGISLFQWYRDDVAISGATNRNYTVVSEDVGHTLVFEVIPVSLTGISPGAPIRSLGILIKAPCTTGCVAGSEENSVISTSTIATSTVATTTVATSTATTTLNMNTATETVITTNTDVSEKVPFKSYLKLNSKSNNVEEVKAWQTLLNKELNINLPITGFFGEKTFAAVKAFQEKYTNDVLKPWDITEPTGYVYKTTRALGNKLFFNHLEGKVTLDNGKFVDFK